MLVSDHLGGRATIPSTIFGKDHRPGQFLPFYVPRDFMPQVDEKELPRFVADALTGNLAPGFAVVPTNSLHAHQRVSFDKVRKMDASLLLKPLLVSSDAYVLDGNHRHAAAVRLGTPWVPVITVASTFAEAIDWMLDLPYVYEINTLTPERR